MSIQQLLIFEGLPAALTAAREVLLHFLSKAKDGKRFQHALDLRSVPGIKLADDFDAPLEAFADYRPSGLAGESKSRRMDFILLPSLMRFASLRGSLWLSSLDFTRLFCQ
jgi:hypothetical protein